MQGTKVASELARCCGWSCFQYFDVFGWRVLVDSLGRLARVDVGAALPIPHTFAPPALPPFGDFFFAALASFEDDFLARSMSSNVVTWRRRWRMGIGGGPHWAKTR